MRKLFLITLSILVFTIAAGCMQVAGYERDYKGRVVDAETGQPIPGVVVLGVWYTKTPTPAGSTSHFHDAKETVTDGKGEFTIPGKGLKILSSVDPMDVLIFKAGYEHIGMGPWNPSNTVGSLETRSNGKETEQSFLLESCHQRKEEQRGHHHVPPYRRRRCD